MLEGDSANQPFVSHGSRFGQEEWESLQPFPLNCPPLLLIAPFAPPTGLRFLGNLYKQYNLKDTVPSFLKSCLADELTGSYVFNAGLRRRCPEVGFEEIASDFLQARFWITTSVLPMSHREIAESGADR